MALSFQNKSSRLGERCVPVGPFFVRPSGSSGLLPSAPRCNQFTLKGANDGRTDVELGEGRETLEEVKTAGHAAQIARVDKHFHNVMP